MVFCKAARLCVSLATLHLFVTLAQSRTKNQPIDASLANLLKTRFKLGLFDPEEGNPYTKISRGVVNPSGWQLYYRV